MSLFDSYKQSNSNFVSQHTGSIVPEVAAFTNTMMTRYNEAADQEDVLMEALTNMSHLGTEEDSVYASELKQQYATRIADRAEKGDYENLGRKVRRDAKNFVNDYAPLIKRQQTFQAIQQRVMDDEKIFDPETKQRILGYVRHQNRAQRDENGALVRDASGRVQLGSITDWDYAKDVNIQEKVTNYMKVVEKNLEQSGFVSQGDGTMMSETREFRTKEDMMNMALKLMESDPEIRAYMDREEVLQTYTLEGENARAAAESLNISEYERLLGDERDPKLLQEYAKSRGTTVEALKIKPLDLLRQKKIEQGRNPDEANVEFLKYNVRQRIKQGNADIVSDLLKVERVKKEVRTDDLFMEKVRQQNRRELAEYTHKLSQLESEITPITTGDWIDGEEPSYTGLNAAVKETEKAYAEALPVFRQGLGDILAGASGYNKPKGVNEMREWNNRMNGILNNKEEQTALLNSITDIGKKAELQSLFNSHDAAYTTAIAAKQTMASLPSSVKENAIDAAWKALGSGKSKFGSKFKTREELKAHLESLENGDIVDGFTHGYRDKSKGVFDNLLNPLKPYEDSYFRALDKGVREHKDLVKRQVSVFSDAGNGRVSQQNKLVTSLAQSNPGDFRRGKSTLLQDIAKLTEDMEEKDKRMYMNSIQARIATTLSPSGEMQAVINLPDGSTKTYSTGAVNPNKAAGLLQEMMKSVRGGMSDKEYDYAMKRTAVSLGDHYMKYTNVLDLENSPVNSLVDVNDTFAFKIKASKGNSKWGSPTIGELMIKKGKTAEGKRLYESAGDEFKNLTIEQLRTILGSSEID